MRDDDDFTPNESELAEVKARLAKLEAKVEP